MSSGTLQKNALGITRQQGILIGTLGLVLIGVVFTGQGSNVTNSTTIAPGSTPHARRRAASDDAPVVKTKWPALSLDQSLEHNPFAALKEPATGGTGTSDENASTSIANTVVANGGVSVEPSEETCELEQERRRKVEVILAELKSQKVRLILRTDKKVSAIIGDRQIHEGDVIDGVRVVSILPNGVLVEPASND